MSTEHAAANGGAGEDRAHQKSFKCALRSPTRKHRAVLTAWPARRKYRKLRHRFKEVMKKSDELFKQEQLAKAAMRRMQEENT